MKKRLIAAAAASLLAAVTLVGTSPTTAVGGYNWERTWSSSAGGNEWE